jgi:hypothetical protein
LAKAKARPGRGSATAAPRWDCRPTLVEVATFLSGSLAPARRNGNAIVDDLGKLTLVEVADGREGVSLQGRLDARSFDEIVDGKLGTRIVVDRDDGSEAVLGPNAADGDLLDVERDILRVDGTGHECGVDYRLKADVGSMLLRPERRHDAEEGTDREQSDGGGSMEDAGASHETVLCPNDELLDLDGRYPIYDWNLRGSPQKPLRFQSYSVLVNVLRK